MWAQKQRKNCFGRRKIDEKADEEKEKRFDWKRKIRPRHSTKKTLPFILTTNRTTEINQTAKETKITQQQPTTLHKTPKPRAQSKSGS